MVILGVCILLLPMYAVLKAGLIVEAVKRKIKQQETDLKYVLRVAKKQML